MDEISKIEREVKKAREHLEEAERRLNKAKDKPCHNEPPFGKWVVFHCDGTPYYCYRPHGSDSTVTLIVHTHGSTSWYYYDISTVMHHGWKPVNGQVGLTIDGVKL